MLATGAALAVAAGVGAAMLLPTGGSSSPPPNVSCGAYSAKPVSGRRAMLTHASSTAVTDTTLVIVDRFCQGSPRATVLRGLAQASSSPLHTVGSVPVLSAGPADDVPAHAVAIVGGVAIARSDYRRWLEIARGSSGASSERDSAALTGQVMRFLVLERWVAGESAAVGMVPSAKFMDAEFEAAKRKALQEGQSYDDLLRKLGMTDAEARFQTDFNTVYALLRERALLGAAPVTDAAVAALYHSNPGRWARPVTRDLLAVLTKTASAARAARADLDRGRSWAAVAERYSIDSASRDRGARLPGVAMGTQDKLFEQAVFSAEKGILTGPVKTAFGYYLFEVEKVNPARRRSLTDARPAIRRQLEASSEQAAADAFDSSLQERWKAVTLCAPGLVTDQCRNDS